MIDWKPIDKARSYEGVLVTSEFYPGWFDIGAKVLGEWRRGYVIAGDLMEHSPTHYAELDRVKKTLPNKTISTPQNQSDVSTVRANGAVMNEKSYWQAMWIGSERSAAACKSWFSPLADDMTPHKAEILCDVATDREKKIRAFMKDAAGVEYKLERTLGRKFSIKSTRV